MTTCKVWRYAIPSENGEGWAIMLVDASGCCAVLSDWGSWSYRWNIRGLADREGMREFLLRCDDWYLSNKLCPDRVYDGEKTFQNVKRTILEMRREGSLDAEQAREEWDKAHYEVLSSEYDFQNYVRESSIPEAYEMSVYSQDIHVRMFLEKSWPKLRALIVDELEKESAI